MTLGDFSRQLLPRQVGNLWGVSAGNYSVLLCLSSSFFIDFAYHDDRKSLLGELLYFCYNDC